MRKKHIVSLLLISLAVIAVTLLVKNHSNEQAEAYKNLFAGNVGLTSITFEGQQKSIKIDDRFILDDFENAFKNKAERLHNSGICYNVVFILKTGTKIKTVIYFYEDKSGFEVADYSRMGAGDPAYVNVDFPKEINSKTQELLGQLLPKK
ncbi:MAG: hypothetical protein WCK57_11875 [Verrucomicrobiae bacterium]